MGIEPTVARKGYEQARSVAVRIARRAKDESLAVTPAEQRHQADVHARATGVVEIGVGARQSRPHAGPAGMDETKYRQSCVRAIGLENPYRFPFGAVILAIVPDHHAHLVAAARQRPAEQGLLNPFTGDIVLPVFGCQDRQILEPDEADFHSLGS
jgi:hypothetical protein